MHTKLLVFLVYTYTYVYGQNNWTCPTLWYDDGYYCDCNCGIYDPDCELDDSIDWGCEDNCIGTNTVDTIPPVIVLIGDASVNINNLSSYNELGTTATDNIDGNITDLIAIDVMDMDDNPAVEVTRTVNILEEFDEEELGNLHNFGDEECPNEGPGYIKDCSSEAICCPSTWIGDGLCDDKNSTYGCDFSCIKEESVDCVPPPQDSIEDSATSLRCSILTLWSAIFSWYAIRHHIFPI